MKIETFRQRLADGKSVSCIYRTEDGKDGLISVWVHQDKFVITWEECPLGEQFDEASYTRDERRQFESVEQVLDFLRASGIDPLQFTP